MLSIKYEYHEAKIWVNRYHSHCKPGEKYRMRKQVKQVREQKLQYYGSVKLLLSLSLMLISVIINIALLR